MPDCVFRGVRFEDVAYIWTAIASVETIIGKIKCQPQGLYNPLDSFRHPIASQLFQDLSSRKTPSLFSSR